MRLHLLLPDLVPAASPWPEGFNPARGLSLSALETLVARASHAPEPASGLEGWLADGENLPSAPLCLLAEGLDPGADVWLHADPVHLGLQRTGLTVADCALFSLTREEADALVSALNAHFTADGLEFIAPVPHRWYARSRHPVPAARPLWEARGGAAEANPFQGDDGRWQRLLSEIQMLLHAHPVNAAREEQNEPAINSLWLWGAGTRPEVTMPPFDVLYSDIPFATGLFLAAGGKARPIPASARLLLDEARGNKILAILDSLRAPAAYSDPAGWQETLQKLENGWFSPLLQALEQGEIHSLTLHLPAPRGRRLEIRRGDLWKLWRRTPLAALFES